MDPEELKKEAEDAVSNAKAGVAEAEAAATEAKKASDASKSPEDKKQSEDADAALAAAKVELAEAEKELAALEAGAGADELLNGDKLNDGTDPKKPVTMPFDKFRDLNEKAKLFGEFGPLLAKLKSDPELVKKLMAGDDPGKTVSQRLKALEDREREARVKETKTVITKAIATWPDFKKLWEDIKPILSGLENSGVPYAEAVQRAYFAVRPDAVKEEARLVEVERAQEFERERGAGGRMGGGGGPIVHGREQGSYTLSESDREFATAAGIDPALYEKHAAEIEKFRDL